MGFFDTNRQELIAKGFDPARLPPGQYLTDRFPVLHVGEVPTYKPGEWSLSVGGLVERPSVLSFDDLVGWSENPHWGFRGDIYGTWGGADDYGVYAGPLADALPAFGFWGEEFYANGDASALTRRIDAGTPVLVWLGLLGDTGYFEYADDGTRYLIAPGQHTLVIYGYDEDGVYASDPALGAKRFYDWGWFMSMWNVFDGMGLAVGPS